MKTAAETAAAIKALFNEHDVHRARISEKTIKAIACIEPEAEEILHVRYMTEVINELSLIGILCGQLPRGGYGLITTSNLEGAKVILFKTEI